MPLRFRCVCGQKLKAPEALVGKRAKCSSCGRRLRVPQSTTYFTVAEEATRSSRPADETETGISAEPLPERPLPAAPAGQPQKPRIVVADASDEDRRHTVELLRAHGYEVIEAADGGQALDMIRAVRPDAAILDVKLDVFGGFQLIQKIRDPLNPINKEIWTLPIIMTVDKVRGRDKQYAISLGVQGFLVKPVTVPELCPRLEKAIRKYRGH